MGKVHLDPVKPFKEEGGGGLLAACPLQAGRAPARDTKRHPWLTGAVLAAILAGICYLISRWRKKKQARKERRQGS